MTTKEENDLTLCVLDIQIGVNKMKVNLGNLKNKNINKPNWRNDAYLIESALSRARKILGEK